MTLPIRKALEGKYEILEKIGEGGIGSVYRVRHRLLEEVRVIKVLRPQAAAKEELQDRFLHEARMAIRLKHPNIAQLHDFAVTEDGTAYIVMEYIDGVGVDHLLQTSGPPSIDLAVEITGQALTALGYLHAHRFVHRDISPDNLMVTLTYDDRPMVKLIDLGIAKNLEGEMNLTATGVFVGKVKYSSPEQFSTQGGGDDLDHRSDLYSLGVMLYELLTGEMPVTGETFSAIAGGHLFNPPRSFEETDPDHRIPDELRAAVFRALEKQPEDRYASAEEFADCLSRFHGTDVPLGEELSQRMEAATADRVERSERSKPGSTQNRLDEEFALQTTPSPVSVSSLRRVKTTIAAAPDELARTLPKIDDLLAAHRLERAEKAILEAESLHGPVQKLLDRRQRLADLRRQGPAGSRPTAGKSRRAIAVAAAAAVVATLALAGGAWLIWGGDDRTPKAAELADGGEALEVQPTSPWKPPETDSGALIDRQVPVPPPFEEKAPTTAAPPPSAAPASNAGQSPPAAPPPSKTEPAPPEPAATTPDEPAGQPVTTATFTEGEVGVVPPVLLELPEAVYPYDKKPKKEIVVVVGVLVNEFGEVTNPWIIDAPMFKGRLKEAALATAGTARFSPATRDGVAGRMRTEVRIVYPPG